MKGKQSLLLVFLSLLLISFVNVSSATNGLSSDPVEENPDYVPPSDSEDETDTESDTSESDYEDSDDEYDSDDEEDSRSMLNKALSKTNKLPSKTIEFIRKNRNELTFACALFAFRREIWHFARSVATSENKDGSRSMRIRISPTAILKIVLFIDFMRKLQQGPLGNDEEGNKMMMPGRLGLVGLLTDFMKPSNTAFVPTISQHYTFEKMNDRYTKDLNAFRKVMNIDMPRSNNGSQTPLFGKQTNETVDNFNSTIVVLEMKQLDSGLSTMDTIRDEVTFILEQHKLMNELKQESKVSSNSTLNNTLNNKQEENIIDKEASTNATVIEDTAKMEVIILLESPGGSASDYGLAAQQIARLRDEPGIDVTICVDKVAASGGYMMACMSSPGRLYAAPFAIVGSIGVIGQTINIHKSLQNWGVQPLVFRGGKDKAPVGLVGEVTKEGMAKVQDMVDKTHRAFKRHVANARPIMADKIDDIATGDVWLASDALEIGMVDALMTSDDYIRKKILNGDRVLKLVKFQRPRFAFGSPHPMYPSSFHRMMQSVSESVQDFSSILRKVNDALGEESALARSVGVKASLNSIGK